MSEPLSRRYECRTNATAELHTRAQKINLLHDPNLWLTFALMLAVLVMCGVSIAVRMAAGQPFPVDSGLVLLLALGFCVYRVWAVLRTIRRTGKRFTAANPEGSCTVMSWVQEDELRTHSRNGRHTIPLASVKRLTFHKDVVVLSTTDRKFLPFYRDGLRADQWRGLVADIRRENPRLRTNFK